MGQFDPYHKWLGIPPHEQPPHHYRLLGITLFETDADVIDGAADRLMSYVRQCAMGEHLKDSQKILNELSTARLCLIVPETRKKYDADLKAQLELKKSSTPPTPPNDGDDNPFPAFVAEKPPIAAAKMGRGVRTSSGQSRIQKSWLIGGVVVLALLIAWVGIQSLRPKTSSTPSPAAAGAVSNQKPEPRAQLDKEQTLVASKVEPPVAPNSKSELASSGAPINTSANQSNNASPTQPAVTNSKPALSISPVGVTASSTSPRTSSPTVPPLENDPPTEAALRAVAELVIKLGGLLMVREQRPGAMKIAQTKTAADLPRESYSIYRVQLRNPVTISELEQICTVPINALSLDGAGFSDEHLATVGKADCVSQLTLGLFPFSDAGMQHLTQCRRLKELSLHNSSLAHLNGQFLRKIESLERFSTTSPTASDDFLSGLAGHPRLKYVSLWSATVTGTVFAKFTGMPQFVELELDRCALTSAGLQAIVTSLPQLQHLAIEQSPLTDESFELLGRLTNLGHLELSSSKISDAAIRKIALPKVNMLQLQNTAVTGEGFRDHSNGFPALQTCYLSNSRFTNDGLQYLAAAAPRISYLNLDSTAVTDDGLQHLVNFKNLNSLSLMKTKVTDRGIEHLLGLENLRSVYLPAASCTPAAAEKLRKSLKNATVTLR